MTYCTIRSTPESTPEPSESIETPLPTTTQKRKRTSSDTSDPAEVNNPPKRARLTKQNLRRHCRSLKAAKHMARRKAKCTSQPASAESPPDSSDKSTVTSTDSHFGEQLTLNGVIYDRDRYQVKRPKDADDVKTFLNKSRDSPVPDEADWDIFGKSVKHSINEASLQLTTWFQLAKLPRRRDYYCRSNLLWTEVEDSRVTNNLSPAKPDVSESFLHEMYPTYAAEALGWALAPTGHNLAMPTFAAELKALNIGLAQAVLQCAHDGAIMADAAKRTQDFLGNDFQYETTQALTVAFNGDCVKIYANHVVNESTDRLEFHHSLLFSHLLREELEDFQGAYKHVRNAQDWCFSRATATLKQLRQYQPPKVTLKTAIAGSIADPITPPQSTPVEVPPPAITGWLWSEAHQKYHRCLPDGTIQWSQPVEPMPEPATPAKKLKPADSPPDSQ